MAKKVEKVNVNGKELTGKEVAVLEAVKNAGKKVMAADLMGNENVTKVCGTIASVRSTMARLEKTHGLIKGFKVLNGDKVATAYGVGEAEAKAEAKAN